MRIACSYGDMIPDSFVRAAAGYKKANDCYTFVHVIRYVCIQKLILHSNIHPNVIARWLSRPGEPKLADVTPRAATLLGVHIRALSPVYWVNP